MIFVKLPILVAVMFFILALPADAQRNCILIGAKGPGDPIVRNVCSRWINLKWYNKGFCRNVCQATIPANQTVTFREPELRGVLQWAPCFHPRWAKDFWYGRRTYTCD